MSPIGIGYIIAAAIVLFVLLKWINILPEYERGVVFRLGRVLAKPKGPGLVIVLWPIDRMTRVSLRTVADDIPSQDVITRDNVSVSVNAVVYFRVVNPIDAIVQIEHYLFATSQIAQTTLRSVLGMVELDELLGEREKLNQRLQSIIDRQTDPWGIKVSLVEVKHVDLPQEIRTAMARQATAEREKRAKVIHAEGEMLAARQLVDAAALMEEQPSSLQLRYLQTLIEMASNRTSTVVFPVPIDIIQYFVRQHDARAEREGHEEPAPRPH